MSWNVVRAAALALITLVASSPPAHSEETQLFIQVWFDAGTNVPTNPDEDPGRFEVTIAGKFVGCALAASYRPSRGEVSLAPISIGFTARGRKEDVKFVAYGELRRLAKPNIKITEAGQ